MVCLNYEDQSSGKRVQCIGLRGTLLLITVADNKNQENTNTHRFGFVSPAGDVKQCREN